jgi:hypothetical protein
MRTISKQLTDDEVVCIIVLFAAALSKAAGNIHKLCITHLHRRLLAQFLPRFQAEDSCLGHAWRISCAQKQQS